MSKNLIRFCIYPGLFACLGLACVFVYDSGSKPLNTSKGILPISAGMLINDIGDYGFKEKTISGTLHIYKSPNGVVFFDCVAMNQRATEVGSDFQRWFFVLDADCRLWVWSSDVGGFVLTPDDKNQYSKTGLTKENMKNAPTAFIQGLPNVVLRQMVN